MANGQGSVTNRDLYDAVNSARLELKADVADLRRQFETLEAGRLTRLEAKMNDFEIAQTKRDSSIDRNQAVLSTKFIIISGIGVVLLTAIANAIFLRLIGLIH